ncbi:MAG: helix-turn-helix transcriptional regulator [Myxococcales bacterium]|nr:helix-turn-helix transcriptional regulator [Myxococcales bacterium]
MQAGPTLAARLRAARTSCGLSRRDAAEASGVSESAIAKIEQGRREPGLGTLGALARAYMTTTIRLLEEAGADDPDLYLVEPRDGIEWERWRASLDASFLAELPADLAPMIHAGDVVPMVWVSGATLAWCRQTPRWISGSRSPLIVRAKAKVMP